MYRPVSVLLRMNSPVRNLLPYLSQIKQQDHIRFPHLDKQYKNHDWLCQWNNSKQQSNSIKKHTLTLQATRSPMAHSITLTLATLQILALPSRWVESAIALTVLLVVINNHKPLAHRQHWVVARAVKFTVLGLG
jgi:HupE / UreJ protein